VALICSGILIEIGNLIIWRVFPLYAAIFFSNAKFRNKPKALPLVAFCFELSLTVFQKIIFAAIGRRHLS